MKKKIIASRTPEQIRRGIQRDWDNFIGPWICKYCVPTFWVLLILAAFGSIFFSAYLVWLG